MNTWVLIAFVTFNNVSTTGTVKTTTVVTQDFRVPGYSQKSDCDTAAADMTARTKRTAWCIIGPLALPPLLQAK